MRAPPLVRGVEAAAAGRAGAHGPTKALLGDRLSRANSTHFRRPMGDAARAPPPGHPVAGVAEGSDLPRAACSASRPVGHPTILHQAVTVTLVPISVS